MSEQINFTKKIIDALPIPEPGKRAPTTTQKQPGYSFALHLLAQKHLAFTDEQKAAPLSV